MQPKTLYDKIWDAHCVKSNKNGFDLLYIDRHYIHEVTSPQAFEGLRLSNRKPWRSSSNFAVPDHNIPTKDRNKGIDDPVSKKQVDTLEDNCNDFDVKKFGMNDPDQGIVHIIGPRARFDFAWYDYSLWRFPYLYTWRIWHVSIWNRHLRGGACPCYTVLNSKTIQDHANKCRW